MRSTCRNKSLAFVLSPSRSVWAANWHDLNVCVLLSTQKWISFVPFRWFNEERPQQSIVLGCIKNNFHRTDCAFPSWWFFCTGAGTEILAPRLACSNFLAFPLNPPSPILSNASLCWLTAHPGWCCTDLRACKSVLMFCLMSSPSLLCVATTLVPEWT